MKARTAPTTVEELLDREAIRDCLITYARAIDRCDRELLESVYWPEGTDNHVLFSGSVAEFIDWVITLLRGMEQTTHALHNILIDLRKNEARVESGFNAYHRQGSENGPVSFTLGGRYLDHMVKRDGEWRILHRIVKMDWLEENHSAPNSGDNLLDLDLVSNRWPDDESYQLFTK